jgi:hypothetical protein
MSHGIPASAYLLGGAGALAMGGGAVLWALGRADRSDLYDRCGRPGECAASDIDSAKRTALTKLVLGDVVFGVGVVAVGAAVWVAIAAKSEARPVPLEVTPVLRGAVVSYGARF